MFFSEFFIEDYKHDWLLTWIIFLFNSNSYIAVFEGKDNTNRRRAMATSLWNIQYWHQPSSTRTYTTTCWDYYWYASIDKRGTRIFKQPSREICKYFLIILLKTVLNFIYKRRRNMYACTCKSTFWLSTIINIDNLFGLFFILSQWVVV